MNPTQVYADLDELSREAAGLFAGLIQEDMARYPNPVVILSGGSTPRPCYERLAELLAPLGSAVHSVSWVIGDERWVPPGDPASNEGMIRRALLAPLGVPEQQILGWNAAVGPPVERARDYNKALRGLLGAPDGPSGPAGSAGELEPAHPPDLTLLGLGQDGHTASLFPDGVVVPAVSGTPGGGEASVSPEIPGWTAAIYVPRLQSFRLTLTAGLLKSSRRIFFLVSGSDKRRVLQGLLNREPSLPAAWLYLPQTQILATRDAVDTERV